MRFQSCILFLSLLIFSNFLMAAIETVPSILNGSYRPMKENDEKCLRGVSGALRVRVSSENCILFEGRVKGHWEEAVALCEVNKGEVKKEINGSMPGLGKTSILLTVNSKVDESGAFSAEYNNTEKAFDNTTMVSTMNTLIKGSLKSGVLKIEMKESGDADTPVQAYSCEYKRE